MPSRPFTSVCALILGAGLLAALPVPAQTMRERLIERRLQKAGGDELGVGELDTRTSKLASKATTISYGAAAAQVMDIYPQTGASNRPVIVMVHGGGWRHGSRRSEGVVDNKLTHFGAKGYVFVSVDYRLMPEANPYEQALDVARALTWLQGNVARYGGDPNNMVIMGHSAGGHLVGLLSADPSIAAEAGAKPWRGTVVLDAGALDTVASLSKKPHLPLYDKAFGADPALWAKASPFARLKTGALPTLLVCSEKRKDKPCDTANAFAQKAKGLGAISEVLGQPLDHAEINANLGLPGGYTSTVDAFIEARLKP